ncbi:hypothetical protein GAY33_05325 [Azospirillum brasilense]|uniref:hypothetical protein n=1 Tax=Azospirillum argentinense TaxID=2970906 RepID=UPI00190DB2D1|nr:hypothetical protein [Azospirillum argentinense]MBK3798657.1 hypothetical protein [Azospirillum argentinense]
MGKKPAITVEDADEIRRAIRPLALALPSNRPDAEVLPPLPAQPTTVEDYTHTIDELWAKAQRTFMDIGRHLDEAERRLSKADFQRLCATVRMGKSARSQLMAAYRLISSGTLPAGTEQAGYANVYLCATLTADELRVAVDRGIVGPEMQRANVVEFRKELRQKTLGADSSTETDQALLDKLLKERAKLDTQIAELRSKLGLS